MESAKVEADILDRVMKADPKDESRCIKQIEHFEFFQRDSRHYAIVFEELGKNLYEVIKMNNFRGFFTIVHHVYRLLHEVSPVICQATLRVPEVLTRHRTNTH